MSYRNDHHVLDLWGLGSREALQARLEGQSAGWITAATERYDVRLAMVYPGVFPSLERHWLKVAELHLATRRVRVPSEVVGLWARDPDTHDEVSHLLEAFETTLPPGVRVERALLATPTPTPTPGASSDGGPDVPEPAGDEDDGTSARGREGR